MEELGKRLASIGQFSEQPIPIGNVPCLRAFQSPEKHLCGGRVVAASLERSDHRALMGDVLLPTMEKAFDLSKKLFQGGAVHGDRVAARIAPKLAFLPVVPTSTQS